MTHLRRIHGTFGILASGWTSSETSDTRMRHGVQNGDKNGDEYIQKLLIAKLDYEKA
jgi:hypothetical protein